MLSEFVGICLSVERQRCYGVRLWCVSNSGGIGLDVQTYTRTCAECVEHLALLLAYLYCTFSTAERSAMLHLVMTLMCGSSSCIM